MHELDRRILGDSEVNELTFVIAISGRESNIPHGLVQDFGQALTEMPEVNDTNNLVRR